MNSELRAQGSVRKVLLVAYYFPPLGGAGVQRTLKYVKYLPQFGWQPVVLTASATTAALSDPTLIEDLAGAPEIHRTRVLLLPPALPWRVRNFITRWLLVTDDQAGWYPFALREAARIVQRERVDAIYTTSTPYTAHLVGRRLKRRFGLPWVADFRDPWIDNFSATSPTRWHRRIALNLERGIVSDADRVTVASEPIRQGLLARHPALSPKRVLTIANGYDPDDFEGQEPRGHEAQCMVIVYSGSFYGRRQTPWHFFQGLLKACEVEPGLRQAVRVALVGNTGQAPLKMVETLGLAEVVQALGYRPHRESIGYLLGADLLLLIIGSGPGSEAVFTGKIFEYLAAGKPILALVPPGAAADLVRESRGGVVVTPEDVSAICDQLVALFRQWQRGDLASHSDPAVVARYDRRRLTGLLANALSEAAVEAEG